MEFELDFAPAIELLLTAYPAYTRIGDLPVDDDEEKLAIVLALYREGILVRHSQQH